MLVVRKINKRIYKKFKQKAIGENLSIGQALTAAMLEWLNKNEHKKYDPKALLKLDGFIKTSKPVRWSEEIDETLYG